MNFVWMSEAKDPQTSGQLLSVNLNNRKSESAPHMAVVLDLLCIGSSLWGGNLTG